MKLLIVLILILLYACNTSQSSDRIKTHQQSSDTIIPRKNKTVVKTTIIDSKFPLNLLFGTWTIDTNGPHADFVLDSSSFFMVDYDGDGTRSYILHKDTLTIDYGGYKHTSIILGVTNDSLHLRSKEDGTISHYARWKE